MNRAQKFTAAAAVLLVAGCSQATRDSMVRDATEFKDNAVSAGQTGVLIAKGVRAGVTGENLTKPFAEAEKARGNRELQQALTDIGCYSSTIDGKRGQGQIAAEQAFVSENKATFQVIVGEGVPLTKIVASEGLLNAADQTASPNNKPFGGDLALRGCAPRL